MRKDQLVIWEGCIVGGPENAAQFEEEMYKQGFTVKYECEYKTLPSKGEPNTGNRNDLIFTIQDKDIPKFALWRLKHGIRWWEDYLDSGGKKITPKEVLDKYPNGWENIKVELP